MQSIRSRRVSWARSRGAFGKNRCKRYHPPRGVGLGSHRGRTCVTEVGGSIWMVSRGSRRWLGRGRAGPPIRRRRSASPLFQGACMLVIVHLIPAPLACSSHAAGAPFNLQWDESYRNHTSAVAGARVAERKVSNLRPRIQANIGQTTSAESRSNVGEL